MKTRARPVSESILAHNKELDLTIENLPIGVTLFAPDGKVLFTNMQGALYLGYSSSKDLLRKKDLDSMRSRLFEKYIIKNEAGDLFTADESPVARAIQEKKFHEYTAHFHDRKTGKESWAIARANPVLDTAGELIMVVYSLTDISEQKILQERNDSFMSVASHEINTPVTTIKALVQILQKQLEGGADPMLRDYLTRMGHQIEQLQKLVRDLLDVSKIRAGKFEIERKTFTFEALAKEVIKNCQVISPKHKIILRSKHGTKIDGDRNNLGRVFINLIVNAIKYSSQSNKIIITITHTNREVRVGVQDFGIGISKSNQEKIFQRFFQVGNTSGKTFSGLGIGLYISERIVLEHGGRLWIKSAVGKGSTFFFSLPLQKTMRKKV